MPYLGADALISGVTHDNRKVQPADVFVGIPGFKQHGAAFARDAVAAGAAAILTDTEGSQICGDLEVPVVVVSDPRHFVGHFAAALFDRPFESMLSVGVTGTNGKTTTSHLIRAALAANDLRPLLIGTVGIRFGDEHLPSARTTPEATDLHRMVAGAVEAGGRSLVMEVSSHALSLGRVNGLLFDVGVFTGLTQDHLDFHETMEDYYQAKRSLFTASRSRRAVICIDDEWGARLAEESEVPCMTYSLIQSADWTARNIESDATGSVRFIANGPDDIELPVVLNLPGDFNIANALAALATAQSLGLLMPESAAALRGVVVPGRMERVDCGQDFVALVDYAHTPDAVERALAVARTCATGRLIAVLGCGGDRDSAKRGPMGAAAGRAADLVYVTDDNPRSEDPALIRAAVLDGARSGAAITTEIGNRMEAIHAACLGARPGDCVIVLGKGHESGQEVHGVVTPFDDRKVLAEAIASVVK